MCQITLVDSNNKSILRLAKILTKLNAYTENNGDGTGYCSLDGLVVKSDKTPAPFYKEYEDIKFGKGIYHVRRASNKTTVSPDTAHPFVTDQGTYVFHNGFFTPHHTLRSHKDYKVADDHKLTDTQKYTKVLEMIQGTETLTPEHIVDSLKYFTGPFVTMIGQLGSESVYITRGKDRFMNWVQFVDKKGEIVGTVFNTQILQLSLWAEIVVTTSNLKVGARGELKEHSLYQYVYGSHLINEPLVAVSQPEAYVYQGNTTHTTYPPKSTYTPPPVQPPKPAVVPPSTIIKDNDSLIMRIVKLARNFLSVGEIRVLGYVLFQKDLMNLTHLEFNELFAFLEDLKEDHGHQGRIQEWLDYIDKHDLTEDEILNLYSLSNRISFPYCTIPKSRLRFYLAEIKLPNTSNYLQKTLGFPLHD